MNKRIFVLYTGGTIGMCQSEQGLRPDTALVSEALTPFAHQFDFDWWVCEPLIDSSAVTLANWQDWLTIVMEKLPDYDGILILHGTDTLAYTANMLALALQGVNKPVVLTGSQLPYNAVNSDAPLNLATAVASLAWEDWAAVAIAFHGQLFPAVGSSKVSTETAEGFANWHFGAWAQWLAEKGWHHKRALPAATNTEWCVQTWNPQAQVACFYLIPSLPMAYLAQQIRTCTTPAMILQTYGHGNAPSEAVFVDAIRAYIERGGLVLNISQVAQGCAAAVYAQGDALRAAGVINGGKCNIETANALLTFACGRADAAAYVQNQLKQWNLL